MLITLLTGILGDRKLLRKQSRKISLFFYLLAIAEFMISRTCHWCHVMERESFEDEEVAGLLNSGYIAIKVDREERPDIDHIYMSVCQSLTGHGGWPLTIFMSPDRIPFFAGTYFPRHDRLGMSGLITLLGKISAAWSDKRDILLESGKELVRALNRRDGKAEGEVPESLPFEAYEDLKKSFDSLHGGFGRAPKFPSPHNLLFLLRYWYLSKEAHALEMVEKTLTSMLRGGIKDHIGFGFSRYSTDRKWLIPHFEKMLYDNALLAIAFLEAFQAAGKEEYAEAAREIFTYVLRDMTSPEGGFYSAEDADSEGEEGKFYAWSEDEVLQVLGGEAGGRFCDMYDITPSGNFEGMSIPNLIKVPLSTGEKSFMEECRGKLFEHREKRVHPYKDDKILTSWNGLMIAALAIGGRVLESPEYIKAAEEAVEFITGNLVRKDGRLLARYRQGEAAIPAYIDDYAFFIWGLIELYESTYSPQYLEQAVRLNDELIKLFEDASGGGLFIYGSDGEQLISRPKEIYDGATPSGNSVSALNFLRLARLTGRHDLEEKAVAYFKAFANDFSSYPAGYSHSLTALMFSLSRTKEVIVVSKEDKTEAQSFLNIVNESYRPFTVSMYYDSSLKSIQELMPFITNYTAVNGRTTAYVCENFTCSYPVTDAGQLQELLQ